MNQPLEVLWEDAHVLAVAKPSGLLTQGRTGGEATLEDRVRHYLDPGQPTSVYLGTVHRLDRPVTGIVLWAKTAKAARRLSDQFARHETSKEYWAICEDKREGASPTEGLWEDWLTRSTESTGTVQVVGQETPAARQAATRFLVSHESTSLGLPNSMRWLRLWPLTGRTHQLRAQLAYRDLPIWGDQLYGSTQPFVEGIALHARKLSVIHPTTRRSIEIECPLPEAWSAAGISL